MNLDIKLKTYEQLQNEVITLNTNCYLKDLKIKQLQSNWNSLREWLERMKQKFIDIDDLDYVIYGIALDKMNELEGKDKECF
jgi:hypothetical protein